MPTQYLSKDLPSVIRFLTHHCHARNGSANATQPRSLQQWRHSNVVCSSSQATPELESLHSPTPAGLVQPKKREPPILVHRHNPHFPADVWLNAAVLIDKPQTWTSFDVCNKMRGILRMKKIGHAGTLDPLATGLLIVCTGKGTKHVETFMAQHKEYTGTLRLGEGTPSYDAAAEVSEILPWQHITDEDIQTARQTFIGSFMQLPPMYSAIQVDGQRLYKAARKGKEVERPLRLVHVSAFELTRDRQDRQSLHFRVACGKGTYVRSLVYDMGRALGTVAHLTALRRTKIGEQCVEDSWTLEDLSKAVEASRAAQATQE